MPPTVLQNVTVNLKKGPIGLPLHPKWAKCIFPFSLLAMWFFQAYFLGILGTENQSKGESIVGAQNCIETTLNILGGEMYIFSLFLT